MTFDLIVKLVLASVALFISLMTFIGTVLAVYFTLSAPLRRQERARLFLDLLERWINAGENPEHAIVGLAACRDRSLGWRFHRLAGHIESGLRLGDALRRMPYFLPATVAATLRAGERLGDVRKVLPACRKMLVSGSSHATSAVNFLFLMLPFVGSSSVGIWRFLGIMIVPKFDEIFRDLLEGDVSPGVWTFLMRHTIAIGFLQGLITIGLMVLTVCYVLGPQLRVWFHPVADRLTWWFSWRRKRMLRDFSLVLSVLLDAELPEDEAITLAAASTANRLMIERGKVAVRQLQEGVTLTAALSEFDVAGEFQWRLNNAAQGHGGFARALTGWHESLEAQAYQLEQAVSQLVTTGVVLFNGFFVALIAVGLFQKLTRVVTNLAIW